MSFRKNTKRIFTAALIFWMSGVIVLFCCGTMPAKAAETESCPLAKKGHCSKNLKVSPADFFESQTSFSDCCAAPAKIFDKSRKFEKSFDLAIVAETVNINAPKFFSFTKLSGSGINYQSFVRNRAGTHLRNCVFRI